MDGGTWSYVGPVTAIHHHSASNTLLYARGPNLGAFSLATKSEAFRGRVGVGVFHRICSDSHGNAAAVGNRCFAWLRPHGAAWVVVAFGRLPDLAISCCFVNDGVLAVGFAHEFVEEYTLDSGALCTVRRVSRIGGGAAVVPCISLSPSFGCETAAIGGRFAASGTTFGELVLWSLSDGSVVRTIAGAHDGPINDIAFETSTRCIATVSDDRTVKLWSATDGKCRGILYGHVGRVWRCALTPRFALASCEDGSTRVWSTETSELLCTLWGHSGKHVWALHVWEASDGGGYFVATGGNDGGVKAYNLDAVVSSLAGGTTTELALPPNASVDDGGVAACTARDYVVCMKIALRGGRAFVVSASRSLLVYDIHPPHVCSVLVRALGFAPQCIACDDYGTTVAVCGQNGEVAVLRETHGAFTAAAVSTAGCGKIVAAFVTVLKGSPAPIVLTGGWNGRVGIWDASGDAAVLVCSLILPPKERPKGSFRVAASFCVSETLGLVAIGTDSGSVHLFRLPSGSPGGEFGPLASLDNAHGHSRVTDVVILTDGSTSDLYSTSKDGTAAHWNLCFSTEPVAAVTVSLLERRTGWQSLKIDGAIVPDRPGGASVWGLVDKKIVVQDVSHDAARVLEMAAEAQRRDYDVAFGSDESQMYLLARYGNGLRLSVPSHRLSVFRDCTVLTGGHGMEYNHIRFISPHELITCSADTTLRLWSYNCETKSLMTQQEICGHTSTVKCFEFVGRCPSGSLLFSAGGSSEVLVFRGATRERRYFAPLLGADDYWRGDKRRPPSAMGNRSDGDEVACRVSCMCVVSCHRDCSEGPQQESLAVVCGSTDGILRRAPFALSSFSFGPHACVELESVPLSMVHVSGSFLAVGCSDGTVLLVDVSSGITVVASLRVHSAGVDCLAILKGTADARSFVLFSSGDDQSIVASLITLPHSESRTPTAITQVARRDLADVSMITCLAFTGAGTLVSCGHSQALHFWRLCGNCIEEVAPPILVDIADASSLCTVPHPHHSDRTIIAVAGQGLQVVCCDSI